MGQRDYQATGVVLRNDAHNVRKAHLSQESTDRQASNWDDDLWSDEGQLLLQERGA
jgi:hypothetical protein